MKKFQSLGRSLTKDEQKKIQGGVDQDPISNSCNAFCNSDADCTDTCTKCNPMSGWDKKICERPTNG